MRIARHFTKPEEDVYAGIEFRAHTSEHPGTPDSVFRAEDIEAAAAPEPGRERHPGAEVLPQARYRRGAEASRGEQHSLVALAFGARRGRAGEAAGGRAQHRRDLGQAGLRPPRRHLDLLGAGRAAIFDPSVGVFPSTSCDSCLGCQTAAPTTRRRKQSIWHRRACQGLSRRQDRQHRFGLGLASLIQPVGDLVNERASWTP